MRLTDCIESYLQERLLEGIEKSSAHEYRTSLNVFARWIDERGVNDSMELSIEHYKAFLFEKKAVASGWTISHWRAVLVVFARWLLVNDYSKVIPEKIPRVKIPKVDEIKRIWLSDEEVKSFFEYLRNERKYRRDSLSLRNLAVASLLFGAGLRISEVANLELGDVDILNREVLIRKSKGNKPRTCYLPSSSMPAIRAYVRYRQTCDFGHNHIFTGRFGELVSSRSLARSLQVKAREAGLSEFTSHAGRRFAISSLAQVNILWAQLAAGHSRIDTTRGYVKPSNDALRQHIRANDHLAMAAG